ncbi:MAG: RNA-binding transcriptional accessory protein [Lachnospiraceae bacterium]|nr:RNA-binding transcriptional accessory protein [Lachnospiraceae bacterium]
MNIAQQLAEEFHLKPEHADNIIRLIDEGNTIPFIARYRKEMHGTTDDQTLREVGERLNYLRNLEKKKEDYAAAITEQGKMTPQLQEAIDQAETLAVLEDLYRPYKQKKRTRAMIAREHGLEPLALLILAQEAGNLSELARPYIDAEKEVPGEEAALAGASDILAEMMSEDAALRGSLKQLIARQGQLVSEAKKEEDTVYRLYYAYSEAVAKIPPHRILAINRGEREEVLKVAVEIPEEEALSAFRRLYMKPDSPFRDFLEKVILDSFHRLVFPSLEREIRRELTEKAEEQAIKMFGANLKPLLLQPPVKGKRVLAVDPAYRTGCKLAVVDENGKVLDTGVIYPTPPQNRVEEAARTLRSLIEKHKVDCISIGNGTASKEAEIFVAETIRAYRGKVSYMVVNEAGASVYSASKLGAQEFPQFDVSLRSAVSIARRLQDPLSELVKIDPQSIGVGQYQHDVAQNRLKESLQGVVEDCVNAVGVDLNTASPSILQYVSGISAAVAKNIVEYREANGAFASRTGLKKVKGLGPKAFEQCAGFLRIPGGKEPLDNTGVHPESYEAARKLLSLVSEERRDLKKGVTGLDHAVKNVGAEKLAAFCGVGVPTLLDMAQELAKPGRDIRDSLPQPLLRTDVLSLEDLKPGMVLTGTVRNVIDFGAFVDIGVHQDGLVHISQMTDRFIKHPSEVVKVGDVVEVRVLEVDAPKKRISLTMKNS